jgi:Flp pilus assembly protein TadG
MRSIRRLATLIARMRGLAGDTRGATAIWFGLAALSIAMLTFGGLDFARATAEKVRIQNALDAAVLLAARAGQLDNAKLDALGDSAFASQLQGSGSYAKTVSATFSNGDSDSVVGVATAKVDTLILGLLSFDYLTVGAYTKVKRGQNDSLELALVLDTTGSMSGARLTSLKTAATNLVNTLTADARANVKIAVVPFAQYVNTGVARRNEPWMNVPADWTQDVPGSCWTQTTKTTCQTQAFACVKYNDGVPYNSTCYKNVNCVTVTLKPPITHCSKAYKVTHKYYGCTGSPAYPRNVSDSDPTRRYPGFLDLGCGSQLTPLTTNMTTVRSAITALKATGETYIPSGLAWGFNVISNPIPFTEAAPYNPAGINENPRKAIVLMTDGQNTKLMTKSNGRHDTNPSGVATEANTYTKELCKNIKAAKIDVYTVAFQVTDSTIKTILQECASGPSYYFDAADAGALNKAFTEISLSLRSLFIAE